MLKKIAVFGGNGFVGKNICRGAVGLGIDVISISRTGSPFGNTTVPEWALKVEWAKGNAEDETTFKKYLEGVDGVVSCIGAFGSNEVSRQIPLKYLVTIH